VDARILVEARDLGKKYPNVTRRRDRMNALVGLLAGQRNVAATTVLKNINLRVHAGQSVGLIGENGAGKSTLLKLIVGVLTPSEGDVKVHGKIGALLELGAGFHPDYTGRENISLSAALYGLSAKETTAKTQDIIDFADIGRYIDEPVKHYSSGMIVRLGFAIVATLRPDLLITDEVLAVGDEAFQRKCIKWMEDYVDSGGTLLLVSHSMYHVQKLCRQACWIKEGVVVASGDVFDVTQAYLAYQERKTASLVEETRANVRLHGQEFHLIEFTVNDDAGELPVVIDQGDELRLRVRVHSRDGRVPVVGIGLARADGATVYGVTTEMDNVFPTLESSNVYRIDVRFADNPLLAGSYELKVHAVDTEGVRLFDTLTRRLTVRGESREFGFVRLPHVWESVSQIVSSDPKSASEIES
jgi:lipopolysaccharide transport system ATP-binding protein